MTGATLLDTIREQADRDIAAVWDEARADADDCRAAAARAVSDRRDALAEALVRTVAAATEDALARADAEARRIRAEAKATLAVRLHALSAAALPRFRDVGYPELFAALARELPDREWSRVAVNPADRALAAARFPRAEVTYDGAIVGGLVVTVDGLRIANTLETRLAAAWPDIVAAAVTELLAEAHRD